MNEEEYEAYLHDFIPITETMRFSVERYAEDETVVKASIGPNKSKKGIAFGGSIVSLCLASAWSLLRCRLEKAGIASSIVIQKVETKYLDEIAQDFRSISRFSETADWDRFTEMVERLGRGRVTIECEVESAGKNCARFEGVFVASRR